MMVTALFVRKDSIYKSLGIDSFDQDRDARNFNGSNPVIAHPPCRQWGKLRAFAQVKEGERELALKAVELVRTNGGVLEHPVSSLLWKECSIPMPGTVDIYGGFTVCIDQHWFGHPARKKTLLYIVGCNPKELPLIPLNFDAITKTVGSVKGALRHRLKECSISEREYTPPQLAQWLINVAILCRR